MGHLRTARGWGNMPRAQAPKSKVLVAALAAMVVAPMPLLAWLLPSTLVLPMLSVVLLTSAVVAAFLAWLRGAERDPDGISLWDVAGAFAFLGFASGMLSEPAHVAQLFGVMTPAS